MSELNQEPEKKGLGEQTKDAVVDGVKQGAEKVAKKGMEKIGKKATQEVTKKVASKAALAGPLGYVLFWAIIIILIIIVVVGIVMFVITMPGMVMDKFKEIAKAVGQAIASAFGADTTQFVDNEQIFGVMGYLEEMGYDLTGEGFLTKIYDDDDLASLGYSEDKLKTVKAENGLVKDKDGKIEEAQSVYIYNYLVSDNYVYTVKNFNFTTVNKDGEYKWYSPFLAMFGNAVERFTRYFGVSFTSNWGEGLLSIRWESGGTIGKAGKYYGDDNFKWNDIDIDAKARTLSIKRGWGSNKMVYSLEGWTGRYGMPLEFLLSVHLATKMPDLAYEMTKAFGKETEVEILLHPIEDMKAETSYKKDFPTNKPEGDYIKYSDFKQQKGEWFDGLRLNKEEAFEIMKFGIQSPVNCSYDEPSFELIDQTDNGNGGIFDENYQKELEKYGIKDQDFSSIEASLDGVVAKEQGQKFKVKEAMIEVNDPKSKGTKSSVAQKYGYDYDTVEKNGGYIIESSTINGAELFEGDCPKGDTHVKADNSPGAQYAKCGCGIVNTYWMKKNAYYEIEKLVITREWEKIESNGESSTYRWVSYVYRVYKYPNSSKKEEEKSYVKTLLFDYVMRDLTTSELIDKGILNEDGTTKDNHRCSDEAQDESPDIKKCCETCRKHIKKIMKYMKKANDEKFDTYTPYISKVTGHWYRDVYFALEDANTEFVQVDEEYEAVMGERWTLYETDEDTGMYNLYKLKADGSIGERFYGTQKDADEQGIAVTKKAETIKISDTDSSGNQLIDWNHEDGVWSAYEQGKNVTSTGWERLYTDEQIEEEIQKNIYLNITSPGDITQIEEGQRKQTNKTIKDLFLNNKYFKYDGSQETARIIEKLREKISPSSKEIYYGELDPDKLGSNVFNESVTIDGNKYTVREFSGEVELTQNSLSAFSMLENTHTLDADFIYKDFKELIVELGYFTKEELTDETPRIFAFPVPDIGSGGFPDSALDKKENEFGTQLHSKEDYEANKKNKMAAALQSFLAAETESDNESQNVNEGAMQNIEGIPSLRNMAELTTIGALDGEKSPSQISVGEFLEVAAEVHSRMEGNFWEYCAAGAHSGSSARHTGDGSCPGNYATYESAAANGKTADCSSYVSWVLQEVGLMKSKQTSSGMYTMLAEYIKTKAEIGELKPGDILLSSGHVQINGEAEGDKFIQYNAGSTDAIQKKPYAYDPDFYTHVIRIPFSGSGSTEATFEGYEGGEAVVTPVTGILLEYGTYDDTIDPLTGKKSRINVDMKHNVNSQSTTTEGTNEVINDETKADGVAQPETQKEVIDKVGYAKIMILDDKTYLALESKMKSSATKAMSGLKDEKGNSVTSFVNNEGKYYENKALKSDKILDENSSEKWSDDDIALYGYKEFAELYSEFEVGGNIIYIDGFVCESPAGVAEATEPEDGSEPETVEGTGENLKGTPLTKASFTSEYKETKYEKEDRYNLSSQDATNKLNNENDIKDLAPAVMTVTIDGEEKIILKEGTVIGRTMSNKELVESRGEVYTEPSSADIVVSQDTANATVENKNKVQGNYLRILMRDSDDTVVENVEEYMKLDEEGSGSSNFSDDILTKYIDAHEGAGLYNYLFGDASYNSYLAKFITEDKQNFICYGDHVNGNDDRNFGFGILHWLGGTYHAQEYYSQVGIDIADGSYIEEGVSKCPVSKVLEVQAMEIEAKKSLVISMIGQSNYDKLTKQQQDCLVDIAYQGCSAWGELKTLLDNGASAQEVVDSWPRLTSTTWNNQARADARKKLWLEGVYTDSAGEEIK